MLLKKPRISKLHTALLSLVFIAAFSILLTNLRTASAACDSAPTDKGSVTSSAAVPSNSTYYIWSRNRTTQTGNNAYYLKIDSNCTMKVGDTNIPANTWTWVNYQDGNTANRMSVNLTAGSHSFKFYGSDPSVQVDRLVLTADSSCGPSGAGDNCTNGNSTPPIVVTTPGTTGPTVGGTVQVGSSNTSSKTTVKVDGKEFTSGTGLVGLDTSNLTDGFHDLTIQITNPDGTVQTVTKRILVQNNATLWQKGYNQLYKATNYNKSLTNLIAFIVTAFVLTGIGVGIFIAWSRRLWETLPFVKRIHLPFIHVPGFLKSRRGGTAVPNTDGALVGDMSGTTSNASRLRFTILRHTFSPNITAIATIAAFAIIGSAALLYGSAAANGFIVEPESGTKTGVTTLTDSSAAGGSYILFGTGSCPAGQTGTPPNCTTPPPTTCPAGQTGTPPNCVTPPVTNTTIPYNATVCTGRDSGGGVPNGFWPGAACTGVPAGVTLTNYTGPLTITTAGTTIDAKRISGCVTIQAVNVTIKRSKITGCVGNHTSVVKSTGNNNNTLVEDVEIDGGSNPANADLSAVGYTGLTCRRCNLYNLDKGGHFDGENFTMEYSWIHDLYMPYGADGADHGDGIYSDYSRNGVIKRNNIDAIDHAPAQDNNSGALALYNLYGDHDNTVIENNLFNTDSSICLYVGYTHTAEYDTTRLRVIDNRFGQKYFPTCATWLPVWSAGAKKPMNWGSSNGNVWSGNTYTNGTVVGPPT